MFLSTAIPLAVIFTSPVWAQLNMAQCPAGFDWNRNSLGQDPCTVGSILDTSCRGLAEYIYPPINSSEYYLPPATNHSGDVMCDCNSVMYSLYMACASCQGGQIYSWTKWIEQCPSTYISQYPENIPQGTEVPQWAYYDVTLLPDQTWNESVATNTKARRYLGQRLKRDDPTTESVFESNLPLNTKTPGKTTIFKEPPVPPTSTTDSSEPVISSSTTSSSESTIPSSTTSSLEPTSSTSNTPLSLGRTISTSSSTSLPRSTSLLSSPTPTSSRTSTPATANAGIAVMRGGTSVWAIFVVIFVLVLE